MFVTIDRLCERAGRLSNHIRRYTATVQRYRGEVVSRLEETGDQGRVSFGDPASDPRGEMALLARVARTADERVRFLSFYYALQYIIMEIHCIDLLRYHLIVDGGGRMGALEHCISFAHRRFEELSSSLLEQLYEVVIPEELRCHFVILAVGTSGDRDDIDVAVVDDLESGARAELSRSLSRLAQIMQRSACTLHFHLAEALGSRALTAPIEDYERLVARQPYNAVVASQVLLARTLVGEERLARAFVADVSGRFFHHPDAPCLEHEGFLRAMLGELQEMLHQPMAPTFINPKEDGLRLIKGYLALRKSVHHIPRSSWRGILGYLRCRRDAHTDDYTLLDQALLVLETVRYLYQILVVEEETIPIGDGEDTERLALVAGHLGYRQGRGRFGPEVPFLTGYYDTVEAARGAVGRLLPGVVDHLRHVTVLSFFVDETELGARNLPLTHVRVARRFFGCRFWEDLLTELERPGSAVGQRFMGDLGRLTRWRRGVVIVGLVEWGIADIGSFLRIIVALRVPARALENEELLTELTDRFLSRCASAERIGERLSLVFVLKPTVVNTFLSGLDSGDLERFQVLVRLDQDHESRDSAINLERLVELHLRGSPRFAAHLDAAVSPHPEILHHIADPSALSGWAETLYGQAERFSDLFSRREWLAAYFHLETARHGLEFLAGRPYPELLGEFRTNMHILLRSLYFLCRKEMYAAYRMEWSKRHGIGLYLDAGCVGFQPFAETVRMLVLSFQEDADVERFFHEVVALYVEELRELGVRARPYPDTGAEVVSPLRLSAQGELLRAAVRDDDPLALLTLLRLERIVGTRGQHERFSGEVVEPLVQPLREHLGSALHHLLDALVDRSAALADDEPLDPILMPGGVRDLERFYRYSCVRCGDRTVCCAQATCRIAAGGASSSHDDLERSTTELQVLATARRLLRCDLPSGQIDGRFVKRHAPALRRRPELSAAIFESPDRYLVHAGRKNLELMRTILIAGEDSR